MNITLYKCSSENARLDKSAFLSGGIEITGATIKGQYVADAPDMVFSYGGELDGYNYIRAEVASGVYHYYYAKFCADLGQTVRAMCRRDPLQTFRAQIINQKIIASRSSQRAESGDAAGWNAYLQDSQQPILVPTVEDVYAIHEFSWGSLILLTAG